MNEHVEPRALLVTPVVETKLCRECEKPFTPRSGSGGKPQVFCSRSCGKAYDDRRGTYKPNSAQCGEAGVGVAAIAGGAVAPKPENLASGPETAKLIFHIPRQDEIFLEKVGDSVLIEQADGSGESYSIEVSLVNAVGFARRVLWAAGFECVNLAASENGMTWLDLEDGAEPVAFKAKKT